MISSFLTGTNNSNRQAGGLIAVRKGRSTRSSFRAEVDLGDGRLSPVEYVILEPGKELSLDGSVYNGSGQGSSDESSADGASVVFNQSANASTSQSQKSEQTNENSTIIDGSRKGKPATVANKNNPGRNSAMLSNLSLQLSRAISSSDGFLTSSSPGGSPHHSTLNNQVSIHRPSTNCRI